jgi:D-arabinose 1-dehydrogenase-like Zn-dependent alcohol dehydrogenase
MQARGTVICLAMGKTELDTRLAVIKGLTIIGSSTSSRAELREALDMASAHGIGAKVEIRGLGDVERTMWDFRDGNIAGRVVIDLWS